MSDVEASPDTRSESQREDLEIAADPEPSVSPSKKPKRRKKPKKPKKASSKDIPLAIASGEEDETTPLISMPQEWVNCKTVMSCWLLVTFLIIGLCVITIPIGCVLALIASYLYFVQRGTTEEFGGKSIAKTVYLIAFAAWWYDMIIFALTLLGWIVLVYGVCEDYDHNVCRFRLAAGYFVSAQMCMVFVHAVFSFAAYLKVRDCYMDIVLDEKEAKERFVDMEKQIFEEFRQKRKEELRAKRKKSSKRKKQHT